MTVRPDPAPIPDVGDLLNELFLRALLVLFVAIPVLCLCAIAAHWATGGGR